MKKVNEGKQRKAREKHVRKGRVRNVLAKAIKMRVKRGDTVTVIAGKDKGKTGEVVRVFPRENKVVVEGVALAKRHLRKTGKNQSGRIVERPSKIHASNVRVSSSAPTKKASKKASA